MQMSEKNDGVAIRCGRCGYLWVYRGASVWYASCPMCRTSVKVDPIDTGDGNAPEQ